MLSAALYARVRISYYKCTRDRGCSAHPAFPAPSVFERAEEFLANLGRNAPRECETVSAVIASEATCPPKPWRRRKQSMSPLTEVWIASSLTLLAMTWRDLGMTTKSSSHRQIPPHRRQEEDRHIDRKPETPQDRAQRRAVAEIGEDIGDPH